jgi:hypothetical protein
MTPPRDAKRVASYTSNGPRVEPATKEPLARRGATGGV